MRIAAIISTRALHQVLTVEALTLGAPVHGDEFDTYHSMENFMSLRSNYDAVCVWGWRRGMALRQLGMNVLVMERAFLDDRFTWVSLGWNGLNGRAKWPQPVDSGERYRNFFSRLVHPWQPNRSGYALLLGQVPTDTACLGINYHTWLSTTASNLRRIGCLVAFRPHPHAPELRCPGAIEHLRGTPLLEDLKGASFTVSFNSNSGVDSVINGIPTVTYDPGSMAWDVSSHEVEERVLMPDRNEWLNRMAWRQWLPEELRNGLAWGSVKGALLS